VSRALALLTASLLAAGCAGQAPWPAEDGAICLLVPGVDQRAVQPGVVEGMELALHEVRAWDPQPRWLELETRGTAEGSLEAWHLCQHRGGRIAVGPVDPGPVRTVLPAAADHEVVLLVPVLAGPLEEQPGNVLGVVPPVQRTGRAIAAEVAARGARRVAVLRVAGDHGDAIAAGLVRGAEDHPDLEVELGLLLPSGSPREWVPAARGLAADGVHALVIVGPGAVAAELASRLSGPDMGDVHIWLVDWSMQPEVLAALPSDAIDRLHAVAPPPLDGAFVERFRARFDHEPSPSAGAGYDAVRLAAGAASVTSEHWSDRIAWLTAHPLPGSAFGRASWVARDGLVASDAAWPIVYEVADGPNGRFFLPAPRQPEQGPRYDAPSPGGVAP
jgi:hypothetical protein